MKKNMYYKHRTTKSNFEKLGKTWKQQQLTLKKQK